MRTASQLIIRIAHTWTFLLVGMCACNASDTRSGTKAGQLADGGISTSPEACELKPLTQRAANAEALLDCGTLQPHATSDQITTAKICAEDARDHEQAFRVIWQAQGTDSIVRHAVLGSHGPLYYFTSYFTFDSAGDDPALSRALTAFNPCGSLTFTADCAPQEILCAVCGMPDAAAACRCTLSADGGTSSVNCG
jgi:hypothetical protein